MRAAAFALGLVAVVPVLLLVVLGLMSSISWYGVAFLLAALMMVVGLLTARARLTRWRGVTRAALALITVIVGLRCAAVRGEGGGLRLVTLGPGGETPARRVNRVLPERDLALSGSRLLDGRRFVPAGFVLKLRAVYDRLEREVGEVPSPLGATYLGLQRPEAFDLVVVEPRGRASRRADTAVVFLHGYAGNVAAICWLVALAAGQHGLTTYCPSVGFDGDWWAPHGEKTLRTTLRHVRGRGATRVILIGLSNGARGASELAPRLHRELAGLALLSGLSSRAVPPALPILLLHGRDDPAVPADAARRYLARAGGRAEQVTLPGDHFVLVTREESFRRALSGWLGRRLGSR